MSKLHTNQSFENPRSWKPDEKVKFAEIFLLWIAANDHAYDLYEFLRDMSDDESSLPAASDYSLKLEKLFHKELKNQGIFEEMESHYQKRKEQYKQYLANKETEEMIHAKVQGGIQ